MPHIYSYPFNVRYYECDGYGHVNYSNYLRYMQEAAFGASRVVGYGNQEYGQAGQIWLIRDTEVEYLKPLRYGESGTIKTWVEDFRRVRSRRRYEVYREDTDDLCARGATDWVYLDAATFRPSSIPPEMKAAFFPEGLPEEAPRRSPFPAPPPPPPGIISVRQKVSWSDLDPTGHVNNAAYLSYMDHAGMEAADRYGWGHQRSLETGFGWVARVIRIEYKQQARFGDTLEIFTYLSDMKPASCIRHYNIKSVGAGSLVVRAFIKWAYVEIATHRPARIPAKLIVDFAPNISVNPDD